MFHDGCHPFIIFGTCEAIAVAWVFMQFLTLLSNTPNSFSSGVIPRRLESGTGIPSTIAAAYCWFIVRGGGGGGGGGGNVWGYISGGFNVRGVYFWGVYF